MPIPKYSSSDFFITQKDSFFVQEDNEAIILQEAETAISWRSPTYTLPDFDLYEDDEAIITPEFEPAISWRSPTYTPPDFDSSEDNKTTIICELVQPWLFDTLTYEIPDYHSIDRSHHNLIKSERRYIKDCLKSINLFSEIDFAIHYFKIPRVIRISEIPFYINLLKKYFPHSSNTCKNFKFISKCYQEQYKVFISIFKEKIKYEKHQQKYFQCKKFKYAFHLKIIK